MSSVLDMNTELSCLTIPSPVGSLVLRASNKGLVSIDRGKAARVKGETKAERHVALAAREDADQPWQRWTRAGWRPWSEERSSESIQPTHSEEMV